VAEPHGSDREEFRCSVLREGETAWLAPLGEFDLATAEAVRAELDGAAEQGAERVVVDLRRTPFMDSSGLRLLLERMGVASPRLAIVLPGPGPVRHLFEITGVVGQIPEADPAEAPDPDRYDA
jgi:anti-anti-sigma factor